MGHPWVLGISDLVAQAFQPAILLAVSIGHASEEWRTGKSALHKKRLFPSPQPVGPTELGLLC